MTFKNFFLLGFFCILSFIQFSKAELTFEQTSNVINKWGTFEFDLNPSDFLDKIGLYKTEVKLDTLTQNSTEICNNSMTAMLTRKDPELFVSFILLSGLGVNNYGNYPMCDSGAKTHYFMLWVNREFFMAMCLPKNCSTIDLYTLGYPEIFKNILAAIYPSIYSVDILNSDELTENLHDFGAGFIIFIVIIIIMIFLCIIGTIMDLGEKYFAKSEEEKKAISEKNKKGCRKILLWFSWSANFKSVFFSQNKIDKNLDVLNGVRVLSICWVVFGHAILYMGLYPNQDPTAVGKIFDSYQLNGLIVSATLSVDTFFFLSGFVCTLTLTRTFMSKKFKSVCYYLYSLTAYLHRYIRLFPIMFISFMYTRFIIPNIGTGPVYFFNTGAIESCKEQWWENLLYINNWFHTDTESCVGWAWYLDCDLWFFLLMPWIAISYCFKKSLGFVVVGALTLLSIALQIYVCIIHELMVAYNQPTIDAYTKYFYVKPYCRILPYFIGVIVAWMYMSFKMKGDYEVKGFDSITKAFINKRGLRYFGYILGFVLIYAMVFIMYYYSKGEGYATSMTSNTLYIIFSRPVFTIGIVLIFYPILMGKGRLLFYFLGSPLFGPPAKVTYGVYMFHELIFQFQQTVRYSADTFSMTLGTFNACFVLFTTYVISFIITIIFESPIVQLEKDLLQPKRQPLPPTNNNRQGGNDILQQAAEEDSLIEKEVSEDDPSINNRSNFNLEIEDEDPEVGRRTQKAVPAVKK